MFLEKNVGIRPPTTDIERDNGAGTLERHAEQRDCGNSHKVRQGGRKSPEISGDPNPLLKRQCSNTSECSQNPCRRVGTLKISINYKRPIKLQKEYCDICDMSIVG